MSDPQTSVEIEDVLASIRRLVSEGEASVLDRAPLTPVKTADSSTVPALEVPVTAPETTANSPTAPDKLLLTADQLVENDRESPTLAPLLLTPAAKTADPAPVDGIVHNNSSFASDVLSKPVSDPKEPPLELTDPIVPDPADMWHTRRSVDPEELADATPEAAPSGPDARAQLLSTIADLEAAVDDTDGEFEPDGSETTPVIDWAKTTANGAIFGSRAATTRIADIAQSTAVDDTEDLAEPKAVEAVVADAVIGVETEALVANLDEDLSRYLAAETTLDEEAMREMVRDIVHQELRGALGERITRNVRKLVRREIYRVLSSEEFS